MTSLIKNNLLLILAAIFLIASIWFAWSTLKSSNSKLDFASGNGRIEATEVDVATKLGGRIINIFVDEGDFVKASQLLAQMQVDIFQAQLDEAKAQHQQAINNANSIAAQIMTRESDVAAAQAIVVQRESELDAAQRRFARSQVLSKRGAISLQELDDDRAELHGRQAALNAATAQVVGAKSAIVEAKAQLVSAQAAIKAAAATITRVEVEITDTQLKSPINGRVQYRIAQPGEMLSAGGKILNLIDLSDVYMTFFLPETVVGRLALGSEVHIVLDAAPEYVIPAKVSFVASVAQFTPKTVETASERQKLMFRVKAKIDPKLLQQHLRQIKTGLPGVAWIKLNSKTNWPKNLAIQITK